jgi:hypothetical protein
MNDSSIKISADANVDATPIIHALSDILNNANIGVRRLAQGILGPWIARRDAKSKIFEACGERTSKSIESGQFSAGAILHAVNQGDINPLIAACALQKQENQIRNMLLTAGIAAQELVELPNDIFSEQGPSQDFFNRWRREAEIITAEELRCVWARMLAEEIIHPSSVPLRLLETVKTLTSDEMRALMRLFKNRLGDYIVFGKKSLYLFGDMEDEKLGKELGLLNGSGILPTPKIETPVNLADPQYVLKGKRRLDLSATPLTGTGRVLSQILKLQLDDYEAVRVAKFIARYDDPFHVNTVIKNEPLELWKKGTSNPVEILLAEFNDASN